MLCACALAAAPGNAGVLRTTCSTKLAVRFVQQPVVLLCKLDTPVGALHFLLYGVGHFAV
jgi:hypothetical protein